jgi:hypothetical protein
MPKIDPEELSYALAAACKRMSGAAFDVDDVQAGRTLGRALSVFDEAKRRDPSPERDRHMACARRRMVLALAWCVEHVAD